MRFRLVWICLCVFMITGTGVKGQFYYEGGDTVMLTIDSTKVLLKLDSASGVASPQAVIDSISRIASVRTDLNTIDGFVACSLETKSGYTGFLDSLRKM